MLKIPQFQPCFNKVDLKTRLFAYVYSGGYFTEYTQTALFEKRLKNLLNIKYCSVVNNGTISLSLALLACGVHAGHKVLVPNLTMIATINAVKLIGAKPILVDVEKETLCMDLNKAPVDERTKALIYVTLNGRCGNINGIKNFVEQHKLAYIEDDAQSLFSKYPGTIVPIGNFADVASFSFSMPKLITTGQGGCLCTNIPEMANKIKKIKDFGRSSGGMDIHDTFGINSKFTELQAIVGLSQLKNINTKIEKKKHIYSVYYNELAKIVNFLKPPELPWFVDIYVDDKEKLSKHLADSGIGSRPIYPPINSQKSINITGDFKVSEVFSKMGIWLPSSLNLTNRHIQYICKVVKNFYGSK